MFGGFSMPMPMRAGAAWILGVLGALGPAAHAQSVMPGSSGSARVWFYQDDSPYVSINYATISMNGIVAGSLQPYGGAIYRDMPPGHYRITAAGSGTDDNQAADVDLTSGQEVFVKVLNLPDWATSNLGSMRRDTFYVRLVPAAAARAELARQRLLI